MKSELSKICRKYARVIPVVACLALGLNAVAEDSATEDYVVGVTVKKVRLYDSTLKPLEVLSAKKFEKMMTEHQTSDGMVKGFKVVERGKGSSILSVKLPDYNEPVWLGMVGLEMSNKKRIPCPDSKVGEKESSNPGVTIGFGDSCSATTK
ncbi:MAG: hypothetical protein CL693_19970 [Cellvibrionaceae bacterium]|nr:hypothetical protein [Cellvibrionaceae bacterium]|tara:strand:+ start:8017 stop:8469 length:453 start_codon:yes stop_codon:yes gene_type:complete